MLAHEAAQLLERQERCSKFLGSLGNDRPTIVVHQSTCDAIRPPTREDAQAGSLAGLNCSGGLVEKRPSRAYYISLLARCARPIFDGAAYLYFTASGGWGLTIST